MSSHHNASFANALFQPISTVASRLRDPLLIGTHFVSLLCMVGLAIMAVVSAGTSLLVWLIKDQMAAAMTGIKYVDAGSMPFLMSMNLLAVAAMAILGFAFLAQLRRLVSSVAEGNPFVPENARRLEVMGWLSIVANLLALKTGGLWVWAAALMHGQDHTYAQALHGSGINPGGWLLTLVLFVLARVFRQGISMSWDLEGTV